MSDAKAWISHDEARRAVDSLIASRYGIGTATDNEETHRNLLLDYINQQEAGGKEFGQ